MSNKCEEEFNPWPSFVDIFSSVILVMLLFLLVTLVNLGYYAQFKHKVSFEGSISSNDLILYNNNLTNDPTEFKRSIAGGGAANSDIQAKVIEEQKQKILLLENQIAKNEEQSDSNADAQKTEEIESPGIEVADKKTSEDENQSVIEKSDYLVITYKGNEVFVDDAITKKIKQFLSKAKDNAGKHKILIYSEDIKGQISATIAKQISLARTLSTRNLVRKFGYAKKDVRIDLQNEPKIDEKIDTKNGYLILRIKK